MSGSHKWSQGFRYGQEYVLYNATGENQVLLVPLGKKAKRNVQPTILLPDQTLTLSNIPKKKRSGEYRIQECEVVETMLHEGNHGIHIVLSHGRGALPLAHFAGHEVHVFIGAKREQEIRRARLS